MYRVLGEGFESLYSVKLASRCKTGYFDVCKMNDLIILSSDVSVYTLDSNGNHSKLDCVTGLSSPILKILPFKGENSLVLVLLNDLKVHVELNAETCKGYSVPLSDEFQTSGQIFNHGTKQIKCTSDSRGFKLCICLNQILAKGGHDQKTVINFLLISQRQIGLEDVAGTPAPQSSLVSLDPAALSSGANTFFLLFVLNRDLLPLKSMLIHLAKSCADYERADLQSLTSFYQFLHHIDTLVVGQASSGFYNGVKLKVKQMILRKLFEQRLQEAKVQFLI